MVPGPQGPRALTAPNVSKSGDLIKQMSSVFPNLSLRPRAHGSGSVWVWSQTGAVGLACTRDLLYPIQFGSAIRTSLGRIE